MDVKSEALALHKAHMGKLEVASKAPLRTAKDLSLAYTPGVAEPCLEIAHKADLAYDYTMKGNLIGVVSDGSAVLGLGDIGPQAALPVMEGKALLFKRFAGVDAFPLCVGATQVDDIVRFVKWLEPTLGGVNLEDISAPRCFEIERRLKAETGIPIFHDDQHGTAVVVLAALLNALSVVEKSAQDIRTVISGAGAAGLATADLLLNSSFRDVLVCDRNGVLYPERNQGMNSFKKDAALRGNKRGVRGDLAAALKGADVLIGVSAPGIVTAEMVAGMAKGAVVIAMANPVPEIYPEEAKKGGALVVGTGRSDYPNQVNNVLAFPGIMRGALDSRAREINQSMKIAAARAVASLVAPEQIGPDCIIPDPFDPRVAPEVARAVAQAAVVSGVARVSVRPDEVYRKTMEMAARQGGTSNDR